MLPAGIKCSLLMIGRNSSSGQVMHKSKECVMGNTCFKRWKRRLARRDGGSRSAPTHGDLWLRTRVVRWRQREAKRHEKEHPWAVYYTPQGRVENLLGGGGE